MDFLFTRSDPLEGLYGLPPEKLMPDPADLRGRTFAQEAFDFIGDLYFPPAVGSIDFRARFDRRDTLPAFFSVG